MIRRSLPNCTIDYEVAERMYQATKELLPVDGNPDRAQIIGGYLGWALDEIDRLREALVEERAQFRAWIPNAPERSLQLARQQLEAEGKI